MKIRLRRLRVRHRTRVCRTPPQAAAQLLQPYGNRQRFWETEDDCTLNDGTNIDVLYRDLDQFAANVADVVERFQASNGYTTCMWHNMLTSKVLFDRDGQYAATRQRFDVPFPEELRRNIINRNMRLLTGNLPSYDAQIRKAASRGDKIAVNHRMAAFMESYFDVLFALNRRTHPGEKRLDKLAERDCAILPKDFRKYIDTLFDSMYADQAVFSETLGEIVDDLRQTVDANL